MLKNVRTSDLARRVLMPNSYKNSLEALDELRRRNDNSTDGFWGILKVLLNAFPDDATIIVNKETVFEVEHICYALDRLSSPQIRKVFTLAQIASMKPATIIKIATNEKLIVAATKALESRGDNKLQSEFVRELIETESNERLPTLDEFIANYYPNEETEH